MTIRILCVGRLKENFYQAAMTEFTKRMSRFAKVEICEVADEKAPESLSESQRLQVMEKEGERLLARIDKNDFVAALCIDGVRLSSEKLAKRLDDWMLEGKSSISFVIGGSLGLSKQVVDRADFKLSFSDMTFSHQLIRVMLIEQIYRAFKIIRGEPYHK